MAAYPSYSQLITSDVVWKDGINLDEAANGDLKARGMWAGKKGRPFKVQHLLTDAELVTLHSFYDTNRLLTVSLTWVKTGSTYTCLMKDPPRELKYESPSLTLVEVELWQQ